MNYYLQIEVAKDLLNNNDATVVGVLLAFIVYLIYINNKKENKIETYQTYVRENEKETLKILSELTNVLKDKQEHDREIKSGVDTIKETASDSNKIINNLATVIQNKLLKLE